MKLKNKLLVSVLCFLTLTLVVVGFSSCNGKNCSHKWGDWSVTKEATCIEAQTEERKCDKCGEVETRTSGSTVDHKDEDKNHECDYKCGKADMGKHANKDNDDHDCDYCGEKMEECTYPEGSTICEVCGKDKNATVKPSGSSASKKPNISYYKLFNSARNATKISMKVQNFSYVAKDADTSDILGSITQNGTTELELYVENEKINGSATGNVAIFNLYGSGESANCSFDAIISDGNAYINVDIGEQIVGVKASIDSFLNNYSDMNEESELAVGFVANTVIPMLNTLIELNSNEINDFLGDVYNMLYTFEKQTDGSYIATLDYNKLKTLNNDLATKPVADVIDLYFGKDTFNGLVSAVKEVLDLEPSEVPAYLDANRIDADDLIDAINELVANIDDLEGLDIEAILNSEELEGYTLGMLMFGTQDDSYKDYVDEVVGSLRNTSLYNMYYPDNANELKESIATVIDTMSDYFTASFVVSRSGELVSEKIKVNNFTIPNEYQEETLSFEIELIVNGSINTTWSDIVDEIEDNIVLPDKDDLGDGLSYFSYEDDYGYIEYQGDYYYYDDGIYTYAYKTNYDQLNYVVFMPESGNWTNYMACYSQKSFSFTIATINVDNRDIFVIYNEHSGEVAELVETSSGFKAIFEDGTQKSFAFDFDDYAEDEAAYTAIFFEVFENAAGVESMSGTVEYRYNSKLGQFEFYEY